MTAPTSDPFSLPKDAAKKNYSVNVPGPRPGGEEMDTDELKGIMHQLVHAAKNFIDEELSPERAKATDYYKGALFGNEQEGRSQVVMTEVRDGISAALPSLLRVLVGPQDPVEFMPRRIDAVEQAKQATDFCKYVFTVDNPGFMLTYDILKDGMLKKLGIWKWYWEEKEPTPGEVTLASPEEAAAWVQGQGDALTVSEVEQSENGFKLKYTLRDPNGRARLVGIPPEEFIFLRDDRNVGEAIFVGHRTEKTRGELIAMGVSEEDIDSYGGDEPADLALNEEALARNPNKQMLDEPKTTDSNDKFLYVEGYTKLDIKGTGTSQLWKICTLGPGCYPVHKEEVDERPFAIFCPDPEPHTILGGSWADRLMDLQLTNSSILRATLDSMAAAIFPRTWYKDGDANAADVLNTAIGAPIRTRSGANAVGVFAHPFLGKEALLVLQAMREVQERRVGRNDGVAGLDMDALQSTTKDATTAAIDASLAQVELIARIFAEMTMKPMFRGILRLLAKHQPQQRMVRLRGKWVPVDPKAWDSDMDVAVNVALGSGLIEKKLMLYERIAQEQKEILSTLGPNNPLVTFGMYRNTLAKGIELSGEDPSQFFNELDPKWQPPPPEQPQQDPAMMLAQAQLQIEQTKAQAQIQAKQIELQLKREADEAEHLREREKSEVLLILEREKIEAEKQIELQKLEAEILLKQQELEMKYALQQQQNEIQRSNNEQQVQAQREANTQKAVVDHAANQSDLANEAAELRILVAQLQQEIKGLRSAE